MDFLKVFKNLFILDAPIARMTYFFNIVLIIIVCMLCTASIALLKFVSSAELVNFLIILLSIVFGLLSFYLTFVNMAKRIWDITADKLRGIYWTVGLLIVAPFVPLLGGIVSLVGCLAILFIPGQEA